MKRVILGGFLATGCICDGIAADAGGPRLAGAFDWTGPFIGAHFGYSAGSSLFSASGPGTPPMAGSFGLFEVFDPFKGTGSYAIGLSAGYNYVLPSRAVLGVEADVSFPNTIAGSTAVPGAQGPSTLKEAVQTSGSVRARLGYAPGDWLFYATGGLAWTYNRSTLAAVGAADGETHDLTRYGLAWGAGAELGLSPNWSSRLEYLGTGFKS